MKAFLLPLLFILSFNVFAKPVDGKIVYKLPSGELVKRDVVLEVPARGQGEVVLSGKSFTWKTKDFWTVKTSGQTWFHAAFKSEFMGKKSTILFRGTYLKGTNELMYYGDFYKKKGHYNESEDFTELQDYKFGGGFKFQYTL